MNLKTNILLQEKIIDYIRKNRNPDGWAEFNAIRMSLEFGWSDVSVRRTANNLVKEKILKIEDFYPTGSHRKHRRIKLVNE